MSDPIAEVLAAHQFREHPFDRGDYCTCGEDADRDEHPAHVAAAVRAALGLHEERQMTGMGFGSKPTYRVRYVSDWRPADPHTKESTT